MIIEELRNGIKTYSNWPTIPQLYVKGEFVGGCDIVREMFQAGELQQTLKEKGVAVRQTAERNRAGKIKTPAARQGFLRLALPIRLSANNIRLPDAAPSAPRKARR